MIRLRRPTLDLCRMLVNSGAIDTLVDDTGVITRKNMPKALLRYLQQVMYPPYHELPISQRFGLASHVRAGGLLNVPDLIRMALGPGCLDEEVVNHRDSEGRTLLHHIARRWAHGDLYRARPGFTDDADVSAWRNVMEPGNRQHPWRLLFSDTIRAGSPLNVSDSHGRSPLCTLIRDTIITFSDRNTCHFHRLTRLLNLWLVELHACGIDLQHYGDCEAALDLRSRANRLPHR